MELRQLATFIRVAQFKSFSRAAESLGYSQSAVTVQIRQLEEELGTRLFDRMGKRIALTDTGERFLSHACDVMNQVNQARMSVTSTAELHGSLLSVRLSRLHVSSCRQCCICTANSTRKCLSALRSVSRKI